LGFHEKDCDEAMERKKKKWWGWGFPDKRYPLEERPNF